jgi:alpha-ketoglutarate-dependent taurine dioxygenase
MNDEAIKTSPLHETFGLIIEATDGVPISTLPLSEITTLFNEHGALLFRNFSIDCDGFTEFTATLCHDFSTYQGGGFRWGKLDREKINNNETLLTVTGATQSFSIPLHGEMYYMKSRPTILWFFCEEPPVTAGETILCSGAALLRQMEPTGRDFFSRNPLKYIRHLMQDEWPVSFQTEDINVLRDWCHANDCTLKENSDGSVTIEYVTPAILREPLKGEHVFINNALLLHSVEQSIRTGLAAQVVELPRNACPFVVRSQNDEELPSAIVDQVERTAEALTAKVTWRKGDVLMVDNRRILHGRKKCSGNERKIFVRMGEPAFAF